MADYDWGLRDYNEERNADFEMRKLRGQGFHPVYIGYGGVKYYQCRRGCGTLVWDPETHMKNVCTTFNPEVGNDHFE